MDGDGSTGNTEQKHRRAVPVQCRVHMRLTSSPFSSGRSCLVPVSFQLAVVCRVGETCCWEFAADESNPDIFPLTLRLIKVITPIPVYSRERLI